MATTLPLHSIRGNTARGKRGISVPSRPSSSRQTNNVAPKISNAMGNRASSMTSNMPNTLKQSAPALDQNALDSLGIITFVRTSSFHYAIDLTGMNRMDKALIVTCIFLSSVRGALADPYLSTESVHGKIEAARQTPFAKLLNEAAEVENQDPRKAESLLKQALELASTSNVPSAAAMADLQMMLFYYRHDKFPDGDLYLMKLRSGVLNRDQQKTPESRLGDLEMFFSMLRNSAEMHELKGYRGVSARLLKKRLEIAEQLRGTEIAVPGVFQDRIEKPAWQDLHDFYFKEGNEIEAAKIWKKYPEMETQFKRMKAVLQKSGRYPCYPPAKK
jgi:hypothetical protein